MINIVKHKRTVITNRMPDVNQLEEGEIGLNLTDKLIFIKDSQNSIQCLNSWENIKNKPSIVKYSQEFFLSGAFIVPFGIKTIFVTLIGGGGGGARGSNNHGGGGGGGGFCYYQKSLSVTPESTYNIIIGIGGVGGNINFPNGGDGGASLFDSLLIANGGQGGKQNNPRQGIGYTIGGIRTLFGESSFSFQGGLSGTGTNQSGGGGGASFINCGANGNNNGSGENALTGAGGAGGYKNSNGGNGGSGYCLIEWFVLE